MAINRQSLYAFLALIFLIFSVVLFYLFYLSRSKPPALVVSPPSVTPIATINITSVPSVFPSPVAGPEATLSPVPGIPQDIETIPSSLVFKSDEDNFSVSYSPLRTLYQDKFNSANRYTFYSPAGSFAIHVGSDWSWLHPDRQFNSGFILAGQNTFTYNINLQTIIDIDRGDRKYTIQCVHNAKDDLKNECAEFANSFRFLN